MAPAMLDALAEAGGNTGECGTEAFGTGPTPLRQEALPQGPLAIWCPAIIAQNTMAWAA